MSNQTNNLTIAWFITNIFTKIFLNKHKIIANAYNIHFLLELNKCINW